MSKKFQIIMFSVLLIHSATVEFRLHHQAKINQGMGECFASLINWISEVDTGIRMQPQTRRESYEL